ncbi:unnamed protein product [Mytilus edulis]|uniref:Uncharacterized protein n=1 Tax=Mytilus edulis TaxID=6550 RepID=A0A8S3T779_MYTED|nr:unnamed protein product [Mytilus edulis]
MGSRSLAASRQSTRSEPLHNRQFSYGTPKVRNSANRPITVGNSFKTTVVTFHNQGPELELPKENRNLKPTATVCVGGQHGRPTNEPGARQGNTELGEPYTKTDEDTTQGSNDPIYYESPRHNNSTTIKVCVSPTSIRHEPTEQRGDSPTKIRINKQSMSSQEICDKDLDKTRVTEENTTEKINQASNSENLQSESGTTLKRETGNEAGESQPELADRQISRISTTAGADSIEVVDFCSVQNEGIDKTT